VKKYRILVLTFVFLFLLSCFPVYGQDVKSGGIKKEIMMEMAESWAKAWKTRKGELRYNIMSEKMKREFEEKQGTLENGNLNTSIRYSSPWVVSYTVDVDEESESAEVCYVMKTSPNDYYVMWDYLAFGFDNVKNKMEVIASVSSDLFNYDEPHECVSEVFPHSVSYGNIGEMDKYIIPYSTYVNISSAAASMISSEHMYKDKFISSIYLYQTSADNTGKIITIDFDMTATSRSLPINPAKDEKIKKLKGENIDEYIKLFSEYDLDSAKDINYTLKAKVDLETEGVVSIDLQHK